MEVEVTYCSVTLDKAVKFISKHNPNFLGKNELIRASILDYMKRIALEPNQWFGSTMGFTLIGERVNEGLDSDKNTIFYEILVDPAVGKDRNFTTYIISDSKVKGPINE